MNCRLFAICAISALLAGCSIGPDYKPPAALKSQPVPTAYAGDWKTAEPSAHLPREAWWEIFNDQVLNSLEKAAAADNQDLAVAAARFARARALVDVARSDSFPQVNLGPSVNRQRTSFNAVQSGKSAEKAYKYSTFSVPIEIGWEPDLWGRIRRQTEAAQARLTASADDLEAIKLAIQAEVATDYFTLRAIDAEVALLTDTVETFKKSLELTRNRRRGGIVSDLDVSQAESQLRSTQAQLPVLRLQRIRFVNALASLCGQPASSFTVAPRAGRLQAPPFLSGGLPSELLERRPDIALVERQMAAANAEIGVAKSAFYPRVRFNGLAGFQSVSASTLFDWPSRMWAIGPTIDFPIFTGGRNTAELAAAFAAYDETVARYRQTVLAAFQEVEDQLAAQRLLAEEIEAESAALVSARRTLEIANNRYHAGLVTYLEVATAQSAALDQERAVVQLQGSRAVATVGLIKAVGGGWQANSSAAVAVKQVLLQPGRN